MTEQINICPFCDQSQAYRFLIETANMRVIYPKAPACAFHVLITPKRHVAHLDDLTQDEFKEFGSLLKRLVKRVSEESGFIGYNVLSNNGGVVVRQHVMHCHIHVFLRTEKDKGDPLIPGDTARPHDLTAQELQNLRKLHLLLKDKL